VLEVLNVTTLYKLIVDLFVFVLKGVHERRATTRSATRRSRHILSTLVESTRQKQLQVGSRAQSWIPTGRRRRRHICRGKLGQKAGGGSAFYHHRERTTVTSSSSTSSRYCDPVDVASSSITTVDNDIAFRV